MLLLTYFQALPCPWPMDWAAGFTGSFLLVLKILYLALPPTLAGILHMAAAKLDLLPSLNRPVDGGYTWRGRRIFGRNKTWRGLLLIPVLTALFFYGQAWSFKWCQWARSMSFFDYTFPRSYWTPLTAGFVYGLGYALAELPNSFVKRQLGIGPGQEAANEVRWVFLLLDQGDSVLGCLLALCLFWCPPWKLFFLMLLVGTLLHLAMNFLLYLAGLRKRPV